MRMRKTASYSARKVVRRRAPQKDAPGGLGSRVLALLLTLVLVTGMAPTFALADVFATEDSSETTRVDGAIEQPEDAESELAI
ncbi:MAG: hypothetical protein LBH64_05025, partial [Coriobacteriales bacterium]|nr:hypothetical protein [Coriobacteriales bacterium]